MRIIIFIISLFLLIGIDQYSKWLLTSLTPEEYCIFDQKKYIASPQPSFWGIFPEVMCSSSYDANILYTYKKNPEISILGDYLKIKLTYNTGIAFSLPLHGLLLQFLTFFLISGLLVYYGLIEYPKQINLLDIGYILVISGALCHGYERIVNGYVVDFISVKYFAIFNFADIFISVGFGLIVLSYFLYDRKRNR